MPGTSPVDVVDLSTYPLDRPGSPEWTDLVDRCRNDLVERGMYELPGFVRPSVIEGLVAALAPAMATDSFEQRRMHNIWFLPEVEGVPAGHPALTEVLTVNHTLCGDQLVGTALRALYEWPEFRQFLAATMSMPELHTMDDPLADVNVLSYRPGEALNWHFDRSEFTTTVLLQAPERDGVFEYRRELRSDTDVNIDGVGRLMLGDDPEVQRIEVATGALNVFRGRNTAHRVTTVAGDRERMIAVFSFYDRPGVRFTDEELTGFYGRAS